MNVYSIHFDELDYNKYNFSLFKTYMVYKYISFLTLKPQHYIIFPTTFLPFPITDRKIPALPAWQMVTPTL